MKFDKERAMHDYYKWWKDKSDFVGYGDFADWLAEEIDISDTFPCDKKKPCKNHQFQRINLYLSE